MLNQYFNKRSFWLLAIIILTIITYLPTFENEFINYWDNPEYSYIHENQLIKELSFTRIIEYFTQQYDGHYHPLTLVSLAIDYKIGGLSPWQYHFSNLLLHILNLILVYLLILKLTNKSEIALVVAALFAINPLQVESIAWLSERKTLLYAFFFLLSLLSYINYLKKNNIRYYYYALVLFIISLLSKAQAITLSVTIIAIDYYYDRNLISKKVILEKIPFLVLSGLFTIFANIAQRQTQPIDNDPFSFIERAIFASYSFIIYIVKLLIPFKLSAYYPYPLKINGHIPFEYCIYILPVLLIIFMFFYLLKRNKLFVFGILFFTINIFLLLKIFQIPYGTYIMADRYVYIPSIGLFLILAYMLLWLKEKFYKHKLWLFFITILYILFLSTSAFNRCKIWKNDFTFYNDLIKKYPKLHTGWGNRGKAKKQNGNYLGAIEDFSMVIKLQPNFSNAYINRGIVYGITGNLHKSLEDFNRAIEIDPKNAQAFSNRGVAKMNITDFEGALFDFNKAIEINQNYVDAYINKGLLMLNLKNYETAIDNFNSAIKIAPENSNSKKIIRLRDKTIKLLNNDVEQ
ncbi:MAG: tetratricopeptide repeat protein [Bacteroidales bacterium]|nr:tetratricopeptide repeat protein [Bacteroidales bacterium]